MTTERKCKHVEGEGETHWYCGSELAPDETSPCVDCGNPLIMSAAQEDAIGEHYAYTPSRWLCPAHREQA